MPPLVRHKTQPPPGTVAKPFSLGPREFRNTINSLFAMFEIAAALVEYSVLTDDALERSSHFTYAVFGDRSGNGNAKTIAR